MLVGAGADVQLVNKAGRDARGEAEMGEKMEVVEWLGARCHVQGGEEGEEAELDGKDEDGVQLVTGEEVVEGMEGEGHREDGGEGN